MAFKYAIALTGGIATGKSTVASLLSLNGVRVIDADKISHTILDNSRLWVKENFGQEYITSQGVDRTKLGKLIFANLKQKEKLENYLHPRIKEAITAESQKQDRLGFAYLIDIPLFFEKRNYPIENSVVVYTPPSLQLERFMKRNGFSKEECKRRIASQLPIDEKKQKATWVIDNSKDLKHLQNEVEAFVETIKKCITKKV